MINLIRNENMKIYRRVRTWVMIAILILISGLVSYQMHRDAERQGDWHQSIQLQIQEGNEQVKQENLPEALHKEIEDDILLKQYALEHDIPPLERTMWGPVKSAMELIAFITIFTVIIAGDSVAGEFATGTVKLLLIRPASRSKILLSKYIAAFLFSLFSLAVLFGFSILLNGILYGPSDIGLPYLHLNAAGNVVEDSLMAHLLGGYLLNCVGLVMVVTLAFMISTVFRSSMLSVGLTLAIMFIVPQLTMILAGKYSWVKYTLFANTDLSMYFNGMPLIEGITLPFSIGVLVVHFVAFNVLSWIVFNKRDVAA